MPIKWIEISHDDWKAEPEPGVLLRAERMTRHWWWFAVTINDKTYNGGEKERLPTSEENAKLAAEELYNRLKQNK